MADDNAPNKNSRTVRLTLVAVLLVGFAAAAVWFYRECQVVLKTVADVSEQTSTCAPPTVTSATVLIVLLLVVALLWPDLSEVTVLGVTLKRRIAAVEIKADAVEDRANVIDDRVSQLQTVVQSLSLRVDNTISNSVRAEVNFYGPSDRRDVEEEAKRLNTPLVPLNMSDEDVHWYARVGRLLDVWETLRLQLALDPRGRVQQAFVGEVEIRLLRARETFEADHRKSIDALRRLRNSVAHGSRVVPTEDLDNGIRLIEELIELSTEWIRQY